MAAECVMPPYSVAVQSYTWYFTSPALATSNYIEIASKTDLVVLVILVYRLYPSTFLYDFPTSVHGLSAKSYTALRKKTEIPHVIGRHKCELVDSSVDALSILVFNVLCNNVSNQNKSKQNLSITVTIALTWSAYTQHCLLK